MEDYVIYRNIKRWLFLFGSDLLDLLLPIYDSEEVDPLERYCQLNHIFDKHLNLLAFYRSQVAPDFPLVLVSFNDLTDNSCFTKTEVVFDVFFQTVSPNDCKDDRVNIINSPESMLGYKYSVESAICKMMHNLDKLRNLEFEGEPWGYPMNYRVISESYGSLEGVPSDEVLHFQLSFTIEDNVSCC